LHLERKAGLHAAMATLRSARRLVRVDARRVEAIGVERVRRRQQLTGVVRRHEAEGRVRPAVGQDPAIDRADATIARCAGAVLHLPRMTAAVRVEHFLTRVQDLHGAAALAGQCSDTELEVERLGLAAERAADSWLHDADACDVEVEYAGELAVQVVRHLRRTPDRQLACRIIVTDRAVGLDRRVRAALEEVLVLDNYIGVGDRGIDIAELESHVLRDVAVATRLARLMYLRRITVERTLG